MTTHWWRSSTTLIKYTVAEATKLVVESIIVFAILLPLVIGVTILLLQMEELLGPRNGFRAFILIVATTNLSQLGTVLGVFAGLRAARNHRRSRLKVVKLCCGVVGRRANNQYDFDSLP